MIKDTIANIPEAAVPDFVQAMSFATESPSWSFTANRSRSITGLFAPLDCVGIRNHFSAAARLFQLHGQALGRLRAEFSTVVHVNLSATTRRSTAGREPSETAVGYDRPRMVKIFQRPSRAVR